MFFFLFMINILTATVDPFFPTPPVIITMRFLHASKMNVAAAAYSGITLMSRWTIGTFGKVIIRKQNMMEMNGGNSTNSQLRRGLWAFCGCFRTVRYIIFRENWWIASTYLISYPIEFMLCSLLTFEYKLIFELRE